MRNNQKEEDEMREIKFRARRIDNGRWVYGQYFRTPLTDENSGTTPDAGWFFLTGEPRHCIAQNGVAFVIDEKTIGQYTGLKDSNEVDIYEGDILEDFIDQKRYQVIWDNYGMFLFNPVGTEGNAIDYYEFEETASRSATIVVGNIYENPKLITA
jgi:uncharacterized phage protein (TIGR01671 family)